MFRRRHADSVVLSADGYINDGRWHKVSLSLTPHTSITIDSGRVQSSVPQPTALSFEMIRLGGRPAPFSGCVHSVRVNTQMINVPSLSTDTYPSTVVGVTQNCGDEEPCEDSVCPANSFCEAEWRRYKCTCNSKLKAQEGQCVDPCFGNPCEPGECRFNPGTAARFTCACSSPYTGDRCERREKAGCDRGEYRRSTCRPCVCDHRGVNESVCNQVDGICSCSVSGSPYHYCIAHMVPLPAARHPNLLSQRRCHVPAV